MCVCVWHVRFTCPLAIEVHTDVKDNWIWWGVLVVMALLWLHVASVMLYCPFSSLQEHMLFIRFHSVLCNRVSMSVVMYIQCILHVNYVNSCRFVCVCMCMYVYTNVCASNVYTCLHTFDFACTYMYVCTGHLCVYWYNMYEIPLGFIIVHYCIVLEGKPFKLSWAFNLHVLVPTCYRL